MELERTELNWIEQPKKAIVASSVDPVVIPASLCWYSGICQLASAGRISAVSHSSARPSEKADLHYQSVRPSAIHGQLANRPATR